jgi:hypothetical protein
MSDAHSPQNVTNVIALDKNGGEHKFTKDALDKLGDSFIINIIRLDFPESPDGSSAKIPTVLPATVLEELTKYAETGVVPNPFLYENRVDTISPGDLLKYLGIEGHPIDEGSDHDLKDDLDDEDKLLLDYYERRDQCKERDDDDYDEYDDYDEEDRDGYYNCDFAFDCCDDCDDCSDHE